MANNTQTAEEKKAARAEAEKKAADAAARAEAGKKAEEDKNQGGAGTPEEPPAGAPEHAEGKLYSLDHLAGEFRVPSWQTAALHRLMRWESGKKVSKKAYADALETLKKRPLGA